MQSTSSAPALARIAAAALLLVSLMLLAASTPAHAQTWRLSGPDRPRAGESATYTLRGPHGMPYTVKTSGGGRACQPLGLPGDPAQTHAVDGYVDDNGIDVQQISVARGGSTLCVYDAFSSGTLVASKVVRTSPGRDRLRITAARQEHFPEDNALVTATGYVGRSGDAEFTPDVAEQHEGNVIVTATRISRRCPKSTPDEFAPNTNAIDVSTARFSEQITAYGAFGLGDKLRLCAYLTAQRRVLGDIQTRTLARASTTISADTATTGGTQGPELDVTFGGALAWIIVGLLIAGIVATVRYFARDARPAGAPQLAGARPGAPSPIWPTPPTARPSDPQPPTQRPEADADVVPPHPAERARGRAKPRDVIQDAVDAVADTYRDRLQTILERQDGPDWLAALNQRRDLRVTQAGKAPPRHYQSLEPRAVLTCLGRDPAGMQLISKSAADSARQLAGLINDALHPNPQSPLTEADGHRAWQLYTDITGHIRPGDPFGR